MGEVGKGEIGMLEEQGKALGLGPGCLAAYLSIAAHGSIGGAVRATGKRVETFREHYRHALNKGMPDIRPDDRKNRTQSRPGAVTAGRLRELVEAQGYKCAISGMELKPETASVDHRVPLSRGGAHTIDNVQLVHEQVQRAKGNMTDEEFVDMCRKVVKNASRRAQERADSGPCLFGDVGVA